MNSRLYLVKNSTECGECHSECRDSCTGPNATDCNSCANVRDGRFCVNKCPENKYAANGVCLPCHETCVGCRGPRNTIAPDGCITCDGAIINGETKVERCLRKNDTCPDGYYYDWIGSQEEGAFKPLANKQVCRKCHPRCKKCRGYGFHESICKECVGYKLREQCEDECSQDHYADEIKRECIPCHSECRGCYGLGPDKCNDCRNLKIYHGNPNDNTTLFTCVEKCPEDMPFKYYQNGYYCSSTAIASPSSDSPLTAQLLTVFGAVFCIAILLFSLSFLYIVRQKTKAKKEALQMTRQIVGDDSEPLRPSNVGPNLTKLRIIKESQIRRAGILGMGAFGRVYKGVLIPDDDPKVPVAIKVLMEISGSETSREFLDEAYIMASVDHKHLLNLLGVCMTSQMMLITQLMPLGCLLDYVRNNKEKIGSKSLITWSYQIASGMEYLESIRLVHRDLAARNVLVQSPGCVKITDFGLAKLLEYGSDEYKAAGGKMPIKWLAIECIRHRIFTTKSDVWAFGVTVWELLTYGARPYENVPAKDVPELLESGHKLQQPEICSLDIYMILLSCWFLEPDARPTFKQLAEQFLEKTKDPGRYLLIPGDALMRLPSHTHHDEKDLVRRLALSTDIPDTTIEAEEYLQPKSRSSFLPELSAETSEEIAKSLRYSSDPLKVPLDDEIDSNSRKVGVGDLRLDLPLDEDDYLMPTCQNSQSATPGYMDLIGVPITVDNPEYLMGNTNLNNKNSDPLAVLEVAAPTQTIGIPVSPTETETISDHEYYNDLHRESKHLLHRKRNETTV